MQDEVKLPLREDDLASDFDVVAFCRLYAEIGADPAIDRDSPGRNELVAMTSGSDASRGKEAVQAHGRRAAEWQRGGN